MAYGSNMPVPMGGAYGWVRLGCAMGPNWYADFIVPNLTFSLTCDMFDMLLLTFLTRGMLSWAGETDLWGSFLT